MLKTKVLLEIVEKDNNRSVGDNMIRLASKLTDIVAFNGSIKPHHNMQAYDLTSESELPTLGFSDTHNVGQVGVFATEFQDSIRDLKDFIEAIKSKAYYPVRKDRRDPTSEYLSCI